MTPPGDNSEQGRPWSSLPAAEQLELRETYGHYLDGLPPTCDLDTKVERFERWLRERGVRYDGPR